MVVLTDNTHDIGRKHVNTKRFCVRSTPQKSNVWAKLLGDNIIDPFIIDEHLNGDKYLPLLRNHVFPAIRRLGPKIELDRVRFQQNGCPTHNGDRKYVMRYLLDAFLVEQVILSAPLYLQI